MIWWLVTSVAIGVLGIAKKVIGALKKKAARQRQRWADEQSSLNDEIEGYRKDIEKEIKQAEYTRRFNYLTQLHYEAVKSADIAYLLLSDSKTSLDAIGQAIVQARERRDELLRSKRSRVYNYDIKDINIEIDTLVDMRSRLFPDKDLLKDQKQTIYNNVRELNLKTHDLKCRIRDTCGKQGREWFQRISRRSLERKLGITDSKGEDEIYGVVKWYSIDKGFGFIICRSLPQDVFVSKNMLSNSSYLVENQNVGFYLRYNDKGPWAKYVSVY